MRLKDYPFHRTLGAGLCAAAAFGYHPWSATVALLIVLSHELGDRYFHDSLHDENRKSLAQLKADFAKLKEKQGAGDLKAAFGAKNG